MTSLFRAGSREAMGAIAQAPVRGHDALKKVIKSRSL